MNDRIIGFDLARAYAIFGMFIVNFNFSFGSIMNPTEPIGRFLNVYRKFNSHFYNLRRNGRFIDDRQKGLQPRGKS